MNASDQEKNFLERVKDLLNERAENLDRRTEQRLEHARMEALRAGAEKPSGFFSRLRWVMVGGLATVTMTATALFVWLHTHPAVLPARNIEDFEILTSKENIDFYQNLDFYRWLAAGKNGLPSQEKPRNG